MFRTRCWSSRFQEIEPIRVVSADDMALEKYYRFTEHKVRSQAATHRAKRLAKEWKIVFAAQLLYLCQCSACPTGATARSSCRNGRIVGRYTKSLADCKKANFDDVDRQTVRLRKRSSLRTTVLASPSQPEHKRTAVATPVGTYPTVPGVWIAVGCFLRPERVSRTKLNRIERAASSC